MKNIFVEKRRREAEWNSLTPEERHLVTTSYKKHLDPEIEQEEIRDAYIKKGFVSFKFLKTIIQYEMEGSEYVLMAH